MDEFNTEFEVQEEDDFDNRLDELDLELDD